MRLIRFAVAAVIAVAAVVAVWQVAWIPWRCRIEQRQLQRSTNLLDERRDNFIANPARQNAEAARRCALLVRIDPSLYLLAADNYRMAEDWPQAEEMLVAALRYDRRPELYYGLGLMRLSMGQVQQSEEPLVQAALFDPNSIMRIPADEVRMRVMNEVGQRRYLPWWGPDQPFFKRKR